MKYCCWVMLVLALLIATPGFALVNPQVLDEELPLWLAEISIGTGSKFSEASFCYGALISSKQVLSSAGCYTDAYKILDLYNRAAHTEYSVSFGEGDEQHKVARRYFTPDSALVVYELEEPVAQTPIRMSTMGWEELFGQQVEILSVMKSQALGDALFNPAGTRTGSCTVNGKRFYDTGMLCYIFANPAYAGLVRVTADIIDPDGPERPATRLDELMTTNRLGATLYLKFTDPGSFPCLEDMGMPITRSGPNGERELVGIVNATGMGYGVPLCSASLASWYTAVAYYQDFIRLSAKQTGFFKICPAAPVVKVIYLANSQVGLEWKPVSNATGYKVNYSSAAGVKDILSVDVASNTKITATLKPGVNYEVAVQAYNNNCTSVLSRRQLLGVAGP